MSALIHLLNDVVGLTLLLGPSYLIIRALRSETPTLLEAVSETLLLGVTAVSVPVFTLAMLTRQYLTGGWMLLGGAALGVLGGALVWRRFGTGWRTELRRLAPQLRLDKAALIGAALVGMVFLVNYDRQHFQYGCINGVVMQALTPEAAGAFDPHGDKDEDAIESEDWGAPVEQRSDVPMGLLDVHGTGQRLGTTAIIAPMVALFDVFGFRLTYALLPVMCLLFAVRLIRQLTGNSIAALAIGLFGVLNPYVLKIVILDENVMAFCFSTAALALLVERRLFLLAGAAFGAALGIRHIDLPFGLAAAVLIGWRPKALLRFGVATAGFSMPCALHHHFTYGSVFQHEHFVDEIFVAVPHNFMGRSFDYTGLLNWPFYETWIRTPYNPLPTALYYPANLVAHVGTLMGALALLGAGLMILRHGRLTLALLTWLLPQYALLAVLENWMDPNKMGILITLFPALLVAWGVGASWLTGVRQVLLLLIMTGLLSLGMRASDGLRFSDDPRFYEKYPRVRPERPEYYTFERSLLTSGHPLPSIYFAQQYTRFRPLERLNDLAQDYVERGFRRTPPPIAAASGTPVTLRLDVSRPLMGRADFLAPSAPASTPLDATSPTAQIQVDGLTGWDASRPLSLLVARNATAELDIYLRFGEDGFADVSSDRVYSIEQRARPHLTEVTRQGTQLAVQVRPGDRIRVLETVSLDEVLVYVWEIEVGEDGVVYEPSTPRKMFHN